MTRPYLNRIVLLLILIGIVLVLLWQFLWRPIQVHGFEVQPGELVVETMGTGTLEARVSGIVSPRIQGRIIDLRAEQGDVVSEGQILVALDDADLQRQVEVAEATVESSEAALTRLRTDQRRAQAVLRQAQLEIERTMDAYGAGAASATERDRAIERLEIAEAEMARTEAALVEARSSVVAAQRMLELHRAQLDHATIRSPFDALVVRRDRERGDVVVPGSSIYRVVATDTLWVSAWVDETAMAGLKVGQSARVVFRAEPDRSYEGRLARLGREVDPELRELLVDVSVEELPATWAVGQRAEVFITTDRVTQTLPVPAEFLFVRDGVHGVWTLRDGRARWQVVDVGLRGRTMIEITSGLEAGEIIVRSVDSGTSGLLRPGRRLSVQ